MNTDPTNEHNFFIEFDFGRKINQEWLERNAIEIEQAITDTMAGRVLGPSVTANWGNNSLDLDVTIAADSTSDAHRILGDLMALIEKQTGFRVSDEDDGAPSRIRTGLRDHGETNHGEQAYAPA